MALVETRSCEIGESCEVRVSWGSTPGVQTLCGFVTLPKDESEKGTTEIRRDLMERSQRGTMGTMRKAHKGHTVTAEVALAPCRALCKSTISQPSSNFIFYSSKQHWDQLVSVDPVQRATDREYRPQTSQG